MILRAPPSFLPGQERDRPIVERRRDRRLEPFRTFESAGL
jgi:hypothetical protein